MSDDGWIHVVGWERHQHPDAGRSKVPGWIKVHTRLLDDPAYQDLTPGQRALLHGLWMLYARARREVRDSTVRLTRQIGFRVTRAQLDALNHAGFITFSASKNACLEVEVEREVEPQATPVAQTALPLERDAEGSQALVAYFIDRSTSLGSKPPGRVTGQVARQIGELVAEGTTGERIRAGIEILLNKRLHPSTLSSCVHESALPATNGHRGGLTPAAIMAQAHHLASEGR